MGKLGCPLEELSEDMMQTWCELVAIVEQMNLRDEPDCVVWVWNRSGAYSAHSFYAIINYRGVKPVYIPAIWKIGVPPKVQLFLWLVSHNKLATVDNLNKKVLVNLNNVVFVLKKKVLHIFSLSVLLPKSYGGMCVSFWGLL
jgi:hypothetical protein